MENGRLTFALLVGTRGVFSSDLAREGRAELLEAVARAGHEAVIPPAGGNATGAVETIADAGAWARLFNDHRDRIDGVIVSLPNFGDELGIANALHLAGVDVPVLVQACDDRLDRLGTRQRRDAFCGKIAVCNNLHQYGIRFTDTATHTEPIPSAAFTKDLERFAAICRVVRGLRRARIGAIGARPAAFQTVRASEQLLQASGITVVPADLSELMATAHRVDPESPRAAAVLKDMNEYGTPARGTRDLAAKMDRHARLFVAVQDWIQANDVDAVAFQCWTSIQENYGCAACLTMSMLGDRGIPCACEVDVTGATAMYALMLASGNAPAIVDWNNNYGEDRDMCVAQHCGNYPKSFLGTKVEIDTLSVLSTVLDPERCFGAINGKAVAGPMTFLRVSTDDRNGRIRGYLGEGELTDDPFGMLGSIAVCRVPGLQNLLKHICREGFEHHVSMARTHCAAVLQDALATYMGWDIHAHPGERV
jgi:L-fucose isomerase-like protein